MGGAALFVSALCLLTFVLAFAVSALFSTEFLSFFVIFFNNLFRAAAGEGGVGVVAVGTFGETAVLRVRRGGWRDGAATSLMLRG